MVQTMSPRTRELVTARLTTPLRRLGFAITVSISSIGICDRMGVLISK